MMFSGSVYRLLFKLNALNLNRVSNNNNILAFATFVSSDGETIGTALVV